MIKVTFKKVLRKGEKRCEYVSCEALCSDDLPERYLSKTPNCYKLHSTLVINTEHNTVQLSPKDRFDPAHTQMLLNTIRKCGKRLHEINKELEVENEGWEGEYTVCI